MAIKKPAGLRNRLIDKRVLQEEMDAVNARMGFVRDTAATPQQIQELMLADGIRPEDCAFSRELIRMRYPNDEE